MAAGLYSITGSSAIERGACYSFVADINSSTGEYPLSGYLVSGQINRKWDKTVEANWTTEILSATSGTIQFSLTADETASLSLSPLEYEAYLYPPTGCPTRILYGDITTIGGLE